MSKTDLFRQRHKLLIGPVDFQGPIRLDWYFGWSSDQIKLLRGYKIK
jgi:hypothetical protein